MFGRLEILFNSKWTTILLFIMVIVQSVLIYNFRNSEGDYIDIVQQSYENYALGFPKDILFPKTLIEARSNEQVELDSISKSDSFKILSILSLSCVQCLEDLSKWRSFEQELDSLEIERSIRFVFVTTGPSRRYVSYMLSRHPEFTYPVLYDSMDVFVKYNSIPEVPATLLLDSDNNVVTVGSPVLRQEIKSMYLDHLKMIND